MEPIAGGVIRAPQIKVVIDRWDWSKGDFVEDVDITEYVKGYQFQKSLKTPAGTCKVTTLPQYDLLHFIEMFNTMDVLRVFEFGALKYQGYITKIAASGSIGNDGKPARDVQLDATSFGGYLLSNVIGHNLDVIVEQADTLNHVGVPIPLKEAAATLATALDDAARDGLTFAEAVSEIVDAWLKFLDQLLAGNNAHRTYLNRYIDFTTALRSEAAPGYAKEFYLFTGEEEELNLWSVLTKFAEVPFFEFFVDDGPRKLRNADGTETSLGKETTYLIGRGTPYDGTVVGGVTEDRFSAMRAVQLDLTHLLRFDFTKSMDEVYSVYGAADPSYNMSLYDIIAQGQHRIDGRLLQKYLYRPLYKQLFYVSGQSGGKGLDKRQEEAADTLLNWYAKNDQYFSGAIRYMVPPDPFLDWHIGDKAILEGLETAAFYVESVTHTWSYLGALVGTAHVTRGIGTDGAPVKLANKLFRKGKWALQ